MDVTSRIVVMGSTEKKTEAAMRSKPVSNMPSGSQYQFLSPSSCTVWAPAFAFSADYNSGYVTQINSFLPRLLLVLVFQHSNRNEMKCHWVYQLHSSADHMPRRIWQAENGLHVLSGLFLSFDNFCITFFFLSEHEVERIGRSKEFGRSWERENNIIKIYFEIFK